MIFQQKMMVFQQKMMVFLSEIGGCGILSLGETWSDNHLIFDPVSF